MITKEDLDERHNKRILFFKSGKSHYGSEPSKLYVDGYFNEVNWNGGDGLIRHFTDYLEDNQYHEYEAEFDYLNYGYTLISHWQSYEDVKYVTIILRKYCHEAITFDHGWTYDSYLIVYYKNRGKTEEVRLNGKIINYDEYIHLLNIIQASGHEFNLKP